MYWLCYIRKYEFSKVKTFNTNIIQCATRKSVHAHHIYATDVNIALGAIEHTVPGAFVSHPDAATHCTSAVL